MSKSKTPIVAALAMTCALAAPADAGQAAGKPAADFTLQNLSGGGTTRLSELRGKVVLVDFWATWCEPCMKELPELEKLHQQLAARGVVIVGVSIDKERKNALELVGRLKLTLKAVHDPDGKVAEVYDPPKMPSSYVIDREGVVRYVNQGFAGAADAAAMKRQLEQLSAQAAPAPAPPVPIAPPPT